MLFVVDLGLIGWLVMRAYRDGMCFLSAFGAKLVDPC